MTLSRRTCPLLLASLLSVWARANTATEPVPRTDEGWLKRQAGFIATVEASGDKASLIFIGDSITQGWEGDGQEIWARYYAPRQAINLGIGGDRTQHVLWRLDHDNLKGLKPKAAVVMIGTNNSNGEDNSVGEIAAGVAAIVRKLQASLPETKVLLLGIFPRGETPNAQRGKLCQINQILQKLDDGKSVFYLDIGHRFITADGTLPKDLMPDFLHLSPQGYRIWAEAIEPQLSTLIGDRPVAPAPLAPSLTGEWVWTINGPDGQPVSAPLKLKQSGSSVTGQFAAGPDKWLDIQDGKVEGNRFTWVVKRTRSNGETMVYQMSGQVSTDNITGQARTQLDGNEIASEWTARRN